MHVYKFNDFILHVKKTQNTRVLLYKMAKAQIFKA